MAHSPGAESSLGVRNVLVVVGCALLIGTGLASMAYWLITFQWVFFGGLVPLAAGGFLLFTRYSGPDHA